MPTPDDASRSPLQPAAGRRALRRAGGLALGLAALAWAGCGATPPEDPVVEVAPLTVTLQAGGGSQQFAATVLNASDTSVVWKVGGVVGGNASLGTITAAGLYHAPAAVPAGGAVTVEALSVADANSQGTAEVTLTAPVGVGIAPPSATVAAGASQQFTSTVANATDTAVVWSVNGTVGGSAAVGTISSTGLYTAPATFPGLTQVTIGAASVADPEVAASALVALAQPVTVAVAPASATVLLGASQAFAATISGSANAAVTWSVNGVGGGSAALGTINAQGVFTAPAAVPAPAVETVTATSQADSGKSASAAVTVAAPVGVSVSPATASLLTGASQAFAATISGSANAAVTWSVNGVAGGNPTLGTITAQGLFTAPGAVPAPALETVTATSQADPTKSASAAVTILAPVAVSVSPAAANVLLGASQAFAAAVTGSANLAVTWTVNGVAGGNAALGTITAQGVFTAPAALPAPPLEQVTATSVADPTKSASAAVTVTAPVSVAIAPAAAALGPQATQQFTATVSHASNPAVTWTVNGTVGGSAAWGTVSAAGLYTAPASFGSLATVTVAAASVEDPAQAASAVVTFVPPVAVTLSPASATVVLGATQAFADTVTGSTNTAVSWSVGGVAGGNATVGTIDAQGNYTAPAALPNPATETVTATSQADHTKSASATVTLAPPVAVTISPVTATVVLGATQAFADTVTGSTNTAVTWSVGGVAGGNATVGTIDTQGNYTAPAALPTPATATITATSQADHTKSASAMVTLVPPVAVTISPATATVVLGAAQAFAATVTGSTNTAVTWSVSGVAGGNATVGTIDAQGNYAAPGALPIPATETVTATSQADHTKSASATVTLVPPVAVGISPATVTVNLEASQLFAASITGSPNIAVTWSVNGVNGGNTTLGTIDAQGNYNAPDALPTPATETVTATSVADATKSASATLTLQVPPAAFTLSPASATLSLGKAASGSLAFQVAVAAGFATPIQMTVSGLPMNVSATLDAASVTASGTVNLTLTSASISLAQGPDPITLTASSTDAHGNAITQTATVALTITGWAGHVSTLAGGPGGVGFADGTGTADELDPSAIASDGGQNLYFADKRGTALRAFGLGTQTVTTLLGGPYNYTVAEGDGMAYDAANQTLYVADALRNRIIAYTLGADNLTVVAGGDIAGYTDGVGAAAQFDYPHGLAISPDHTTLYVADTNNEVIRSIQIASGAVTTLAGQHGVYRSTDGTGAAASFCQPIGLGISPSGTDLYVTDQCGYVVRQIALPGAAVTTVAGSGAIGQADGPALAASFIALGDIHADPHAGAGRLYLTDGNEIREVVLGTTSEVFTLAGAVGAGQADGSSAQASFYDPRDLAPLADAAGAGTTSLFIADTDNGLLRRMDIMNALTATSSANVTLAVSTLAGQPSHRGASDGVGTGPGYAAASVAEFSQPEGIVTDGTTAYVADSQNGAIRKIDLASTAVTTVAGPALGFADGTGSGAAFFQNAGLAWVPSLNVIFIADTGNGAIRRLDLATQAVTTIAGTNASGYVDGPLLTARFNHPFGILASADGTKLYVADTGNNAIRLVDLTAGTVSTIAGNGGLGSADGVGAAARFAEPNGLAFDATGANIYISDFENQAIRELNLSTLAVTTLVGMAHQCGDADGAAGAASLCNPAFITTDGRSLFWGDANTGLLRVLNLSTLQVSTLAGSPGLLHMADGDFIETPGELAGPVRYNGVFGLAVAPDDSFILFTDKTANVIRIIY